MQATTELPRKENSSENSFYIGILKRSDLTAQTLPQKHQPPVPGSRGAGRRAAVLLPVRVLTPCPSAHPGRETGASEPPKGAAVIAASWSVPLRAHQSLRCGRAFKLGVLADPGFRPGLGEPALSGLFLGRSSGRRSLRTVSPGAFFPGDPRARRPASVAVDVMSRPPDRRPGNARNTPFRGQVGSIGGKVFAFCGNPGENFQHPENTPRIAAKKSRRNTRCTGFYSLHAVALQAAAASLVPKRP